MEEKKTKRLEDAIDLAFWKNVQNNMAIAGYPMSDEELSGYVRDYEQSARHKAVKNICDQARAEGESPRRALRAAMDKGELPRR